MLFQASGTGECLGLELRKVIISGASGRSARPALAQIYYWTLGSGGAGGVSK